MTILSQTQGEPVYVQPRRSIGGLYADVIIEETHEDSLEITEHPVEQGAAVSDHAYVKPVSVTIHGGVTDSTRTGGERRGIEFYQKLRELQAKREPFDIITGKRAYKNMLLQRLTVNTTADTENSLIFSAECREVIIVGIQTASVPPRARQSDPARTGGTANRGQQQAQATGAGSSGAATTAAKDKPYARKSSARTLADAFRG